MTVAQMMSTSRPAPRMDELRKAKKGSRARPPSPTRATVSSASEILTGCRMFVTMSALITLSGTAVRMNSAGIIVV